MKNDHFIIERDQDLIELDKEQNATTLVRRAQDHSFFFQKTASEYSPNDPISFWPFMHQ